VIAIGALAGTVALLSARAAGEGASLSATRLQSRLTMRSGVLALQQLAGEQRLDVLGGAAFDVETPMEVFTDGDRVGTVRLDDSITPSAVSLDALLDVNTATASMLARLPGVDETLGAAIAARLPVASLAELLEVEGVNATMLFGEYEDGVLVSDEPPLASLLTVGSIEPPLTTGIGEGEPGRTRLLVDWERGDQFAAGLVQMLGEASAEACLGSLERLRRPPQDRQELLRTWISQGVELEACGRWLDVMRVGDGLVEGRIDINRAPAEVLGTIPGFDEDGVAQRLIGARQGLPPEDLASVLWPLEQGIVDEDGMLAALDRVTTRSVRWVLRAQAGLSVVRERSVGIDSLEDAQRARAGMSAADDERLRDQVAMDLLVDFAGDRVRVIPLGEVSVAQELDVVARAMRVASGSTADAPDGIGAPEAGATP